MKSVRWLGALAALVLLAPVAPSHARAQTVSAVTVSVCGTPGNSPVVGNPYPLTQDTTGTLCTAGGGGGGGAVTINSGGVHSGAYASGAMASGAYASGSIASGAYASGSIGSGAVAAGALAAGAGVDGWDLTQGAKADTACASDNGTCSLAALLKRTNQNITTLNTTAGTAIPAGTAIIGKVGIDQTTDGTTNAVHLVAGTAIAGKVGIDQTTDGTTNAVHLVAGTAIAGKFGVDQTTPGTTNAVQPIAGATGGATAYGLQSAASTNSTSVKGSAGVLYGLNLINTTTTIYYLRLYDSASAPTCSSATNFVRTWPVPPAAASGGAGGIAANLPISGVQFSNGIAFCVTGGPSSTDNTNAATGVFINLDYK